MGRRKLPLEKLPSEQQRKAVYRTRSKGVIKKANELSVMCDVNVCVLMFSCTGKPDHVSGQPGIWKIIQRFIQSSPEHARMKLSQENIDFVNKLAAEHNRQDGSSIAGAGVGVGAGVLLQHDQPGRENDQQMEAGMREPMLQQGVQYVGTGYPNSVPLFTSEETGPSNVYMSDKFYGHQQEWMMEYGTTGDPCLSSYEAPVFNGHKNVRDPVLAPLHGEYLEQNTQQGMDISGDVQPSFGQPSSSAWCTQIQNSTELNIQCLENFANTIAERREQFVSQPIDGSITGNPAPCTRMPMQQPQGPPEAGMWGPHHGGESIRQLRTPEFGIYGDVRPPFRQPYATQANMFCVENSRCTIASKREQLKSRPINRNRCNPSLSTEMPMQQPQGAPEAGMWGPQHGGEYMQQLRIPEFGMGNQSNLPSDPIFGAHRNIDNSYQKRLNQAYYKDITKFLMDDT